MKKITVTFAILIAVVAATASFTSCKKDLNGVTRFSATIAGGQHGKTVIDNTGHLQWRANDQITIFGSEDLTQSGVFTAVFANAAAPTADKADFNLSSGDAPSGSDFYAIYPSSIATTYNTVTLSSTQNLLHEFPMYAHSNNTELVFHNLCGLLKVHLTKPNVTVTQLKLTFGETEYVSGNFLVEMVNNVPTLTTCSNGSNTVILDCGDGVALGEDGADFYFYLPAKTYSTLHIEMTAKNSANEIGVCKKVMDDGTLPIAVGQYTSIAFDATNTTYLKNPSDVPGTLTGIFSVSATKKVYFSQGNLQFIGTATPHYWKFADNQWDVIAGSSQTGSANRYVEARDRDLFAYGTSNLEYNGNTYYPWGNYSSTQLPNQIIAGTSLDWGANAIDNGGQTPGLWYTLTSDEWQYLIAHSGNAHNFDGITNPRGGSGYGQAKVHGVKGLVLFPDNVVCPSDIPVYLGWHAAATASNWHEITDEQWTTLANLGCVFLPSQGYSINGAAVPSAPADHNPYYHSSTQKDNNEIYCLRGYDTYLTINDPAKNYRIAVRLVRDAQF